MLHDCCQQDVARNSGVLLWLVLLAVDGRELSLRLTAQHLLKVTHCYHYPILLYCVLYVFVHKYTNVLL
jgi:hypothetical protein